MKRKINKRKKVLGIGEVVLDRSQILSAFPKDGEKVKANKSSYSVGGPVPAALVLLSRLGVDCTLICSLGDDEPARIIKKKLKKEGIKLIINKQKKTKVNLVLVNGKTGSRTIIKDDTKHSVIENIDEKIIKKADLIITDRHEPRAYDEIMAKKRKTTNVVIDPSTEVSEKTMKMIATAEHPILPIESLNKLNSDSNMSLKQLHELCRKKITITAGNNGSYSYDGKVIHHYDGYKVNAIDTLGAGDVYRGAYAYGVLNNWCEEKLMNFANLMASLQCTRYGNGTAIPSISEARIIAKSTRAIKCKIINKI